MQRSLPDRLGQFATRSVAQSCHHAATEGPLCWPGSGWLPSRPMGADSRSALPKDSGAPRSGGGVVLLAMWDCGFVLVAPSARPRGAGAVDMTPDIGKVWEASTLPSPSWAPGRCNEPRGCRKCSAVFCMVQSPWGPNWLVDPHTPPTAFDPAGQRRNTPSTLCQVGANRASPCFEWPGALARVACLCSGSC